MLIVVIVIIICVRSCMFQVATDMFFINLGGVVLRLAKPIVQLNKKGTDRTKFIELHYALPQPEKVLVSITISSRVVLCS